MSIKVDSLKDLVIETKKVLNSSQLRAKMINNQSKYINKNATKDICNYIIKNHI